MKFDIPSFYDAITEFIFVKDEPVQSDIILLPGCPYDEPVHLAASLYRDGFAPRILPSGKYSKNTGYFRGKQPTEWAYMRDILLTLGVPSEAILREDEAEFTWQNAIFSRKVLEERGEMPETALLCVQSYHARRALTYYQQQFPDTRFFVIPAAAGDITAGNWFLDPQKTAVVLGELRRCGEQFSCMLPINGALGYDDGRT